MVWSKTAVQASTTARGYGTTHQHMRAKLLPYAYGTPCSRCGAPMLPGQALHLDHNDTRTGYLGFSHAACNLSAAGRKGRRVMRARMRSRLNNSRRW